MPAPSSETCGGRRSGADVSLLLHQGDDRLAPSPTKNTSTFTCSVVLAFFALWICLCGRCALSPTLRVTGGGDHSAQGPILLPGHRLTRSRVKVSPQNTPRDEIRAIHEELSLHPAAATCTRSDLLQSCFDFRMIRAS